MFFLPLTTLRMCRREAFTRSRYDADADADADGAGVDVERPFSGKGVNTATS